MRVLVAAAVVLVSASPALAAVLKVPSEDFPSIQSAVNAAQDGDTVLVKKGTYAEDVVIDSKSNLTIRGAGKPVLTPVGVAFTITNGSVVSISGFRVESGAGAIDATTTSGLTVSKLELDLPTNTPFRFDGCASVLVSRCKVTDASVPAFWDMSSSGLRIERNSVTLVGGQNAVELSLGASGSSGSNDAVLSRNRFEGSAGVFLNGTGILFERNSLLAGSGGVLLTGATETAGTVLSRNRIEPGGVAGIQSMVGNVTFERNTLVGGSIVSQGDGVVIERNTLLGPPGNGIQSFGNGNTVFANTVRGSEFFGINVGGGISVVEGNRVYESNSVGIYLQPGTANSLLLNNQVKACDSYGIVVYATPVTVTGNRSTLNGLEDYADSNAEGVNTLTDNRFGTTLFNYSD